jgi:predicted dehydrogenase
VGAGLIGRRHIADAAAEAVLDAIVDPAPQAERIAAERGVSWFPSLAALLTDHRPDGVIVATPNQMHIENGLACIAAGVPALIEKPIADDVVAAARLADAAEEAAVPILVGHHRRHNPLVAAAKSAIAEGRLGTLVAVQASCWFYKPDSYFETAWRREKGAGPVFINLIHDIDTLRHLCGDIESVQALQSSRVRGHTVEDTAAILLRFVSGALGTITVSDTVAGPWSWELTAGENPDFPATGEACYHIGGTHGALALPGLVLWSYAGPRSWWEPLSSTGLQRDDADPLRLQLRHFLRVLAEGEPPLVSARDALETLRVVAAVKQAAETGAAVELVA